MIYDLLEKTAFCNLDNLVLKFIVASEECYVLIAFIQIIFSMKNDIGNHAISP